MITSSPRLALAPLTDSTWRLCDTSAAVGDADSLVAYIERTADGIFDVTWVAHGVGTARFSTLDEVIERASSLVRPLVGAGGATKPIPIAHRPPLTRQ